MNPEVNLNERLMSARVGYASSKQTARDAIVPGTDQRSNRLRGIYERAKDGFMQLVAIGQADRQPEAYDPIYRRILAETLAGWQTKEEANLIREEIEGRHSPRYLVAALWNRHPWVRTVLGLGTAGLTATALTADVIPYSVPTMLALGASSWLGFEGFIQGGLDTGATRFGLRSKPGNNIPALPLGQVELRLAHLQENRVETGQEGSSLLEQDLMRARENIIVRELMVLLHASNTLWRTWPPSVVPEKLSQAYNAVGENLSSLKQQVLQANRQARRIRLAVAAILGIVAVVQSGYLPTPQTDMIWLTPDRYYGTTIGDRNKSSRHGLIQAIIAREEVGIGDFDPDNSRHIQRFEEYRALYPVEYAKVLAAFDRWFEKHGRSKTYTNGDLLDHSDRTIVPQDQKGFIAGVLGRAKTPRDSLRVITYR